MLQTHMEPSLFPHPPTSITVPRSLPRGNYNLNFVIVYIPHPSFCTLAIVSIHKNMEYYLEYIF